MIMYVKNRKSSTYGHSQLKTGHPVRSAIHKQLNGRLVLRWVTTWESLLLYVLHFVFDHLLLLSSNLKFSTVLKLYLLQQKLVSLFAYGFGGRGLHEMVVRLRARRTSIEEVS